MCMGGLGWNNPEGVAGVVSSVGPGGEIAIESRSNAEVRMSRNAVGLSWHLLLRERVFAHGLGDGKRNPLQVAATTKAGCQNEYRFSDEHKR